MTVTWKFRQVDKTSQRDHPYLTSSDQCFFIHEYTSGQGGKGYQYSAANSLISNLKKPVSRKNKPGEYQYKTDAIKKVGKNLAKIFGGAIDEIILIPIPPSKIKSDPEYDDRMYQVLKYMEKESRKQGHNPMVSELIEQINNMPAAHQNDTRPNIDELVSNYQINRRELEKTRESNRPLIAIFDDVLTAGTHFKAMQKIITAEPSLPETIGGFFIARRVFPSESDS